MPLNVDNLLDQRRARAAEGRGGSFAISVAFHLTLTAAFLFLPGFFKEPQRQIEYITVAIVSPAVLGQQTPAPPPPPPEPRPAPQSSAPAPLQQESPGTVTDGRQVDPNPT